VRLERANADGPLTPEYFGGELDSIARATASRDSPNRAAIARFTLSLTWHPSRWDLRADAWIGIRLNRTRKRPFWLG
jgi:hypothetical protein